MPLRNFSLIQPWVLLLLSLSLTLSFSPAGPKQTLFNSIHQIPKKETKKKNER